MRRKGEPLVAVSKISGLLQSALAKSVLIKLGAIALAQNK
jgi:hypothetical protein